MNSTRESAKLKYEVWAARIRLQIQSGELAPGARLPSFSQMRAHGFSQATLERAHALLEREGLIERRQRSGVFVTPRAAHKSRTLTTKANAATQSDASTRIEMGLVGVPGLIFAARHYSVYSAALIEGMQQELRRGGKQILLLDGDSQLGWERADGVIRCGSDVPVDRYLPRGVPWVSCLEAMQGVPSFVPDDAGGARVLAEHLLELGHRRIACLTEVPARLTKRRRSDPVAQRVAAWRKTLHENGIEAPLAWHRKMFVPCEIHIDYHRAAYHVVKKWLREDWNVQGFTALMAQNDIAAMGAIEALQDAGLRVPEDVSVTGFDGVESCRYDGPEITTVEVPLRTLSADAVAALLHLMKNEAVESAPRVYPTTLLARASTAPPR